MTATTTADDTQHRTSYHGTGSSLAALVFKNLLLTVVTLGVYLPWARAERRRYLWQNVDFGGHRLRFHGTGKEMFLGYLKVAAGYLVLIGVPLVVSKFDAEAGFAAQIGGVLLLLPLIPIAIYGSRRYLLGRTSLRGVRFGLEPGAGGFLKLFVIGALLTVVTLGLYGPVMSNNLRRYVTQRARYGTAQFGYDGTNGTAFSIAMKGLILSALTFGIYYPWYVAEMARFRARSTFLHGARGRLDLTGGDVFGILFLSTWGTVLSLGIAFPWIATYALRKVLSKLSFVGPIEWSAIGQRPQSGDAAGDDLASALDVGIEV